MKTTQRVKYILKYMLKGLCFVVDIEKVKKIRDKKRKKRVAAAIERRLNNRNEYGHKDLTPYIASLHMDKGGNLDDLMILK